MKSFKDVLIESKKKSEVLLFGRMNPLTSGHEENVLAAHKVAQQAGAHLNIVGSHSYDPKKNPLSPVQKLKHLNRAFGHLTDTTISTSSPEHPTILHQATAAHNRGVKNLILVGGEDRAEGHAKLIKQYNGVEGKGHGYYNFDHITVKNTGARQAGISGTEMRKHAAADNYDAFKQHVPSRIASNEKHTRELFSDVKAGLVKKEQFDRESFLAGDILKLGEQVTDSFTGLVGKIVYRGPTYVTMQISEDLSFKRWAATVDENWTPADLAMHHLNRLHTCPEAQDLFSVLLNNVSVDQSLVQTALDKTAHYLDIEQLAAEAPSTIDDHMISAFVSHLRDASQLLHTLGVIKDHESYMEKHVHNMMKLVHGTTTRNENMDNFKNYLMQEQKVDPGSDMGDEVGKHLTDADLKAIEKHIDGLEWEDIRHLYANQEHEEMEESFDMAEANLTAADRMKKKMEFMKTKAKREIARTIALKRLSSQGKLKKKAIVHARHLIMQRILKGRNKASLSAAEKTRIENIVNKAKAAVVRISNRLMPKLRELEKQRLKHMHEDWAEAGNAEAAAVDQNKTNDTPADIHPGVAHAKAHLAGEKQPADPRLEIDHAKHMRKIKNFRKMEV